MTPVGVRPIYDAEEVRSQDGRCKTTSRSQPFQVVRSGNGRATSDKSREYRCVLSPRWMAWLSDFLRWLHTGGHTLAQDGDRCRQVCHFHLVGKLQSIQRCASFLYAGMQCCGSARRALTWRRAH